MESPIVYWYLRVNCVGSFQRESCLRCGVALLTWLKGVLIYE